MPPDGSPNAGPTITRRSFVQLFAMGGASLAFPTSIFARPLAGTTPAKDATAGESANVFPEGWEAVADNPNFVWIRDGNRTPPVWDDERKTMLWVEKEGERYQLMSFTPETPLEWADARERHDLYYFRSWRTPEELRALVAGPGPWMIQFTGFSRPAGLVAKQEKAALLAATVLPNDVDETSLVTDPNDAAVFTADEVLALIPRLEVTIEPFEENPYYEPVTPEQAMKDLRCKRLRTSGWSPQVGTEYSLEQIAATFSPGTPVEKPADFPFVRVPDAWLALIDYGSNDGVVTFPDRRTMEWLPVESRRPPEPAAPADEEEWDEAEWDRYQVACRAAAFPSAFDAELTDGRERVHTHLFVKPPGRPGYVYVGLGDTYPHDRTMHFVVTPAIEREFIRRLGVRDPWEAYICNADGDGTVETTTIHRASEIEPVLSAFSTVSLGSIELRRWGPDQITVYVASDVCFAEYVDREYEQTKWKYLVNAEYAGDPAAEWEFPDSGGYKHVAQRTVHPRRLANELIRLFLGNDGELPWRDRWTDDPFAKKKEE